MICIYEYNLYNTHTYAVWDQMTSSLMVTLSSRPGVPSPNAYCGSIRPGVVTFWIGEARGKPGGSPGKWDKKHLFWSDFIGYNSDLIALMLILMGYELNLPSGVIKHGWQWTVPELNGVFKRKITYINVPFSTAMFDCRRVTGFTINFNGVERCWELYSSFEVDLVDCCFTAGIVVMQSLVR